MKKRILSLILCLALAASLLPAVTLTTPVKATTSYQYNIVDRADYLYNITWICQSTVYGWCGNYTFYSGTAYRLPYGQPINAGAYIGYGVSVDSFISAAKDASSIFYSSRSTYGTTNSVYYATDCSAFVSWCWGIDRKTTYSIPLTDGVTYIGMATAANASLLQLGDCLNSNDVGHVVLVTDLTYDSSGNLTQIEITEQTPPQLKRSYYTPSELGSKYGSYYGIYRYSGTVPAAPNAITTKYYPACDSSYTSLYPALESIGVYCDWTLHCQIAELNGITDFSGTVEQNTQLLDLLKAGELLNPNYVEVVYYPACDDSYTSLYPALESIGIDCDWDLHCRIAAANGIADFTGTVEQNTQLLDLLKAGKLINPDGTTSSGSDTGTGSFANGYENGYAGGMAGDGKIYAHGLDVSEWQGSSLDFNAIKNAGYDFVILRAGTTKGKDNCFETYYTNARAAGLDIGTYYYTYATTVAGAQTDAENMLSWISGKTFEYPVYFDYEDSSQDSLSTTTAQNICLTFCDAMAEAGYLTGIYTGYYKSTQLPMDTICAKYEIWIANYWDYGYETLSPEYSQKYGMYQYTDRNYIGSAGPYDGDVAFKDYPSIVKQYGFNGYANPESYLEKCTVYPSHCQVTTTKSTPLNTLPCSASSSYGSQTLVTSEADETYTAKALYLNASGNYWYQITLDTGETAYLYGGHASFVQSLSSDITLSDAALPGDMTQGDSFTVTGKVASTLNQLDQVSVGVYTGSSTLGTLVIGGSAAASNNACDLAGSEAATATDLSALDAGDYFYNITAQYTGYYATAAKEAATYTDQVSLSYANFTVEADLTYLEQCSFYPAYCQVTTSQTTSVNSLPCAVDTNGSKQLLAPEADVTFTATGLYQNTGGNLWYRVTLDSGETAYLFAGHCAYVQELTSDIYLVDWQIPGNMTVGGSFDVVGTLGATYNRLLKANVTVYSGSDATGTPVTGGSAEVTDNVYPLNGSAVAAVTGFSTLPAGNYLYEVSGSYTNYYAASATELATNEGTKILMQSGFSVTECTHSFTTSVTQNATCTEPGVLERTCSKCGQVNRSTILATGHSYSSVTTEPTCTQDGCTTYTCGTCGDSYSDSVVAALGHSYSTVYTAPTCTAAGKTAYTCSVCSDYFEEPVSATGHRYTDAVVAPGCESTGHTTHTCTVCGYSYSDSLTAATGHSYTTSAVDATCTEAGGTKYTCLTCGDSFIDGTVAATGHGYSMAVTAPTCTENGYTTYTCAACGDSFTDNVLESLGHSYSDGACTVCGATDPSVVYYLFGYINGADYACEADSENLGVYKFEDGKLTASFTQDSYVAVKTGDNLNWYMTDGWQGTAVTNVVLYDTNSGITADKLYVPGGVELTFTLVNNGDGTLSLSYEKNVTVTAPTIALKYPTLSFEDEIFMNVYYTATDLADVTQMGLITYSENVAQWNLDNAEAVIPGYTYHEASGMYSVRTEGIAAKAMGDTLYFSVYAQLSDGSVVYSKLVSYSPRTYAYNQLSSGAAATKPIVVAMLNYGAAAQTYFNYNTDNLVNADLTADQLVLVDDYRADMVNGVAAADSSKAGIFTNSGGFSKKYPTISFEGAFCINYYFLPSNVPSGNVKLYYWNAADYNAATTLASTNATGYIYLTQTDSGEYHGVVEDIAAKDLDGTIYVAAGYMSDGVAYCTGILPYSIGSYCVTQASYATAMQPFAQATAVYGYYAKLFFSQN